MTRPGIDEVTFLLMVGLGMVVFFGNADQTVASLALAGVKEIILIVTLGITWIVTRLVTHHLLGERTDG